MTKDSNKRARLLIRKLNKIRRRQAQKIDILCNDIVSAQTDFIEQLQMLNMGFDFYESILGQTDLPTLLNTAAGLIKVNVNNSNIAIFLTESENFELHMVDTDKPVELDHLKLESYFSRELIENICRSNHVYSLEDMFKMGLQGNPSMLAKINVAAVPLGLFGGGIGFILIYRSAQNKLTREELERVTAIIPGLCRAIRACRKISHVTEFNQV